MKKRQRKKSEKTKADRRRFCHYVAIHPACLKLQNPLQAFKFIRMTLTLRPKDDSPLKPIYTPLPMPKDSDLRGLTRRFWAKERRRSVFRFKDAAR